MGDIKWEEGESYISATFDAHPSVGQRAAGMCFPRKDGLLERATPLGEMRGMSWFESEWASLSDWWENSQDAKVFGFLFNVASVLPWLWGARAVQAVEGSAAVLNGLKVASAAEYEQNLAYLARLQKHLAGKGRKLKVELRWDDDAVALLEKSQGQFRIQNAAGAEKVAADVFTANEFLVGAILVNPKVQGLRMVVHHELLHYRDFLRFYSTNEYAAKQWLTIPSWKKELFVAVRLVISRRWMEYDAFAGVAQVQYIKDVFAKAVTAGMKPAYEAEHAWKNLDIEEKLSIFMKRITPSKEASFKPMKPPPPP